MNEIPRYLKIACPGIRKAQNQPANLPAMTSDFLLHAPFDSDDEARRLWGQFGARLGMAGGHASRTMMFSELACLMENLPRAANAAQIRDVIVEGNCLGKPTLATRKSSYQRLKELYGLEPEMPLFRGMLHFWDYSPAVRPLIAMQAALARDPIFRASAMPIVNSVPGQLVSKPDFVSAVGRLTGNHYPPQMLDKLSRHVAASWTQTGHLRGRVFKHRNLVTPDPVALAWTAWVAVALGLRGGAVFSSVFARLLDSSPERLYELSREASRLGLMNFSQSGGVTEITFPHRP